MRVTAHFSLSLNTSAFSALLCLYSGDCQHCPASLTALRGAAEASQSAGQQGCVCHGRTTASQKQAGRDEHVRRAHGLDDLRLQRENHSGGGAPDVSLRSEFATSEFQTRKGIEAMRADHRVFRAGPVQRENGREEEIMSQKAPERQASRAQAEQTAKDEWTRTDESQERSSEGFAQAVAHPMPFLFRYRGYAHP